MMGIYHLFTIDGNEAEIVICDVGSDIMDYLVYIIAGGLAVIVLLMIIAAVHRKNKKKNAISDAENA